MTTVFAPLSTCFTKPEMRWTASSCALALHTKVEVIARSAASNGLRTLKRRDIPFLLVGSACRSAGGPLMDNYRTKLIDDYVADETITVEVTAKRQRRAGF